MKKIMILNGVNLNFLGIREPEIYKNDTLKDIETYIINYFVNEDIEFSFHQSNIEGEIVNLLQEAHIKKYDGVVLNAGAFTHYSYAIADAIKSIEPPTIEVHISNVHKREEFRSKSVISPCVVGQIAGFGKLGYVLGVRAILEG